MKSTDTYLCKQPKKEHAFTLCGVDYFVGDKLSDEVAEFIYNYVETFWSQPMSARIKLYRFAATKIVDCKL